jgi:cytochrome c oxidase cbb3-type subunit 4
MDLNDIRAAVTLLSFVLFIALAVHTWSRRRRAEHEAAAHLPFAGDALEGPLNKDQGERRE